MATENFQTDNLTGSRTVTAPKKFAAGSYFRGQLLGRIDATQTYAAYNAGGADGTENIRGVCNQTATLSGAGKLSVLVLGSAVNKAGIVDAAGDTLAVTDALTEAAQDGGIIIEG